MASDTFAYDNRSRITSATLSGVGTQGFSYDLYGNLLTKGATTYCTGTCTNNHVTGATYTRGNVTNYAGETIGYDGLNRMISDSFGPYTYAYQGMDRIARVRGGNWTYTIRDEASRVATEYSGSAVSRDNEFLGNLLVASYANGSVGGNGPTWTFYSSDHLGSPRLITDVNGLVADTRKYWPYGDEATTPQPYQRLRFATMERDSEAGTNNDRYFDHTRHHESGLGRFLGPDRVGGRNGDPQSWNRYAYARNNPLKLVDPNGKYFVVANEADRAKFVNALSAVSLDSRGRGLIQSLAADKRPVLLQNIRIESPENVGRGGQQLGETVAKGPFTTSGERGLIAKSATVSVDFAKIADVTAANPGDRGLAHVDPQGIAVTGHELLHAYADFYQGIGEAAAQDARGAGSDVSEAEVFGAQVAFAPDDPGNGLSEQQIDDLIQRPPVDVCGPQRVCTTPQNQ